MPLVVIYRSTDNSKWGPGKDSQLTIAEGDGNLWELVKAIQDLQDNPPEANSIANILVVGSAMEIILTDGTELGPFNLPVAAFRYREEGFVPAVAYKKLDLIPIADMGLYLVLKDHTSSSTFDPAAQSGGEDLYQLMFGQDLTTYDVGFSIPGKPGTGITDGDPVVMHVFGRQAHVFSDDGSRSVAKILTVPDDTLTLPLQLNGVAVGSLSFEASSGEGTVTWDADYDFEVGDILTAIKPAAIDATAKNLVATLVLRRGPTPA